MKNNFKSFQIYCIQSLAVARYGKPRSVEDKKLERKDL